MNNPPVGPSGPFLILYRRPGRIKVKGNEFLASSFYPGLRWSKKLPELAKGLGKSMKEFKKAAQEVQDDFQEAMDSVEPEKKASPPPAKKVPPPAPVEEESEAEVAPEKKD